RLDQRALRWFTREHRRDRRTFRGVADFIEPLGELVTLARGGLLSGCSFDPRSFRQDFTSRQCSCARSLTPQDQCEEGSRPIDRTGTPSPRPSPLRGEGVRARQGNDGAQAGLVVLEAQLAAMKMRDRGGEAQAETRARLGAA